MKPEKNDPCPCGSGNVFEKCCQAWYEAKTSVKKVAPTAIECNHLASLLNTGRFTELENRARLLLEQYPDSGIVWKLLGISLQMQGKDGLAALQMATKTLPNDAEAHGQLGALLYDMERLGEAEASYRRMLEIKPDSAKAWSSLGAVLERQGRYSEAKSCLCQALRDEPDFTEALYGMGVALSSLGELNEAVTNFKRLLELKPNESTALFHLHALLLDSKGMEPSIQCMKDAVALHPDNKDYRFFLGFLLEYTGDYAAATTHLDLVSKGCGLSLASLDAWNYIKSSCAKFPPVFGNSIQLFRFAIDKAINTRKGLILEFGVRHGNSIRQIASLVTQEVHGFDSFEGIPDDWHDEDRGTYSTSGVIPTVPENVILHKGWFEDTLPVFLEKHSGSVCCMNIDCDIYSSTKIILDCFAERIIQGTVIIFDEYIACEQWRENEFKAFQEAATKYGWDYEYLGFSFYTKQVIIRII